MKYLVKILSGITLILILFSFVAEFPCKNEKSEKGKLTIKGPALMDLMLYKSKNMVKRNPEIQGLRIQVFTSTDRNQSNRVKFLLENKFPEIGVYMVFESPEFKVRVGDFRNKMEASPYLFSFKEDYPNSTLVPSKIKFPKIND